jgi:predicted amidohydrolase YtcJ
MSTTADGAILGADLVTTDADELPDAPVAMTIVDGEILDRGADT